MTKIAIAVLLATLSTAAYAQSSQTGGGENPAKIVQPGPPRVTNPATAPTDIVQPGGTANGGPGSAGTEIRGGTGAESRTNNPGADANAGRPELPVGNTGGGGGR